MEYLNVLQFIKQYEEHEDAQRVDELNEMQADEIKSACNRLVECATVVQ